MKLVFWLIAIGVGLMFWVGVYTTGKWLIGG